jgi:hypothetical protein
MRVFFAEKRAKASYLEIAKTHEKQTEIENK